MCGRLGYLFLFFFFCGEAEKNLCGVHHASSIIAGRGVGGILFLVFLFSFFFFLSFFMVGGFRDLC